jgi:hypothetical protein
MLICGPNETKKNYENSVFQGKIIWIKLIKNALTMLPLRLLGGTFVSIDDYPMSEVSN